MFLPARLSPLHCRGSYRVLLRPQHPTWHRTRRMLRHCGTHPPPLQLGRTLHARHSAIRLPWLPLASDNSCTHRLHGDTTALLKILTNIHMHPYVKKRGILYVATSCAVIPGRYVPARVCLGSWRHLVWPMGALRRLTMLPAPSFLALLNFTESHRCCSREVVYLSFANAIYCAGKGAALIHRNSQVSYFYPHL